jgi:predicted RNase H-like nuclease (RuvC/YqgF family)
MSSEDDRHFQDAQRHQYEEIRQLRDSVNKLLVEVGKIDVRAQERHDVTAHTIKNLRHAMESFVQRREIDHREEATHRRINEIETNHETLASKHEQLRQEHQASTERQVRIIGYATMAGTGIGGFSSYVLRKLGIIS